MVEQHAITRRRFPPGGIARGPARAAEAAPEHDEPEPEPAGKLGQGGGMSERIRTVEDRRGFGAQSTQHATAGQKISHQRLATWNELVSKDEPRSSLQRAGPQERSD